MTNTELNKAIFTVLTSSMKCDCEKEYRAVKKAGYDIRKKDGRFTVYASAETGAKYVRLARDTDWVKGKFVMRHVLFVNGAKKAYVNGEKVDFVNLLATIRIHSEPHLLSAYAWKRRQDIKWALHQVTWYDKYIEEQEQDIKRALEYYQERVLNCVKRIEEYKDYKAKAIKDLEQVRREYNL